MQTLLQDQHVLPTYKRAPIVFVDGHGATLRDSSGKSYVDFLGGIAVSALGYAHPRLARELAAQAHKLLHTSNLFRHPFTEQVAERLARLTGLEACFFANSGAEANECALKLARKRQREVGAPERTGFVALEGSFHGRTMGALSVTHTAKYREPFEPLVPGVRFVAPEDAEALERALLETRPAALILEPIQGESGVRSLSHTYLRQARELCTRHGTVLIHDEVQCGSGRTGSFRCAAAAEVMPDVMTLAKPIAGGLPMGVCLASSDLARTFAPGDHGTTFGGGPFVLCGALVFLEEWEDGGLAEKLRCASEHLEAGLSALCRDFPLARELRGKGLMRGLRLERDAAKVQQACLERGLILNVTGGEVLRMLPPYVISAAELDRGLSILHDALQEHA